MVTQEVWQHRTSGEVYVVEIRDADGRRTWGVCGPLNRRDIKLAAVEALEYDCSESADDVLEAEKRGEYQELSDAEIRAIEDQYA